MAQFGATPDVVVPDGPDVTIKTRRTAAEPDSSVTTEIVYLKGARQRRESIHEWPRGPAHRWTTITLCDERRTITLNHEAKIYAYSSIEEIAVHPKRFRFGAARLQQPETTGANVTITIDSVDTGERRSIGRYVARRVTTTTTIEPGPGAAMRASVREQDGWYVDLPSPNCSAETGWTASFLVGYSGPPGAHDRIDVRHLGTARRRHPIEETDRSRSEAGTFATKLELVEFSEAPIDPVVFTVPTDYRRALPMLFGGHDLSKPDTLMNRLRVYSEELTSRMGHLFR